MEVARASYPLSDGPCFGFPHDAGRLLEEGRVLDCATWPRLCGLSVAVTKYNQMVDGDMVHAIHAWTCQTSCSIAERSRAEDDPHVHSPTLEYLDPDASPAVHTCSTQRGCKHSDQRLPSHLTGKLTQMMQRPNSRTATSKRLGVTIDPESLPCANLSGISPLSIIFVTDA